MSKDQVWKMIFFFHTNAPKFFHTFPDSVKPWVIYSYEHALRINAAYILE